MIQIFVYTEAKADCFKAPETRIHFDKEVYIYVVIILNIPELERRVTTHFSAECHCLSLLVSTLETAYLIELRLGTRES